MHSYYDRNVLKSLHYIDEISTLNSATACIALIGLKEPFALHCLWIQYSSTILDAVQQHQQQKMQCTPGSF